MFVVNTRPRKEQPPQKAMMVGTGTNLQDADTKKAIHLTRYKIDMDCTLVATDFEKLRMIY